MMVSGMHPRPSVASWTERHAWTPIRRRVGREPSAPGQRLAPREPRWTLPSLAACRPCCAAWCAQARGGGTFLGGLEAGKTGPTNESRDLLFIGYEPSRKWVMGIWLGNDDNSPTRSSSALAASLWASIIREAGHGSGGAG